MCGTTVRACAGWLCFRKTSWEWGQAESDRIRVCVRKRPLGMREERRGEADVVSTRDSGTILIQEKKDAVDLTQYILQVPRSTPLPLARLETSRIFVYFIVQCSLFRYLIFTSKQ